MPFGQNSFYFSDRMHLYFLLFALLFSCTKPPCDYDIFGEEEFAADSEVIDEEGKYGILSMEGKVFQELPDDALLTYKDTLAEDDLLNVALFHPSRRDLMDRVQAVSDRAGGFRVQEGKLSLPDFPSVDVVGLTLPQAKDKLKKNYAESIQDIDVFLAFKERPSHKVELAGLVQLDNVPVDGRVRLYEILAKAHLPPDANLFASYVLRDDRPLKVDLNRLIRDGDMSQNLVMKAGDKIYIGNAFEKTAIVMGEVRRPRPIPLVTGSISLREALALSGGIPFTGDEKHIQIIRGGIQLPKIFVLSMRRVLHENNRRLLLIPGDVVYVSEKPITKWNVFLAQLTPTLTAVLTAQAIYSLTK